MPPHEITDNNSNQYRIRSMDETDIDIVVAIDLHTWHDSSWPAEDFFHALKDPVWNCWIIESTDTDHLVLGYGLQYSSNGISHIANLCIHPIQRGCGLGKILLRHMIDYAYQIWDSFVELEVNTSNVHAYMLYVKHGFTIVQLLPKYYSDNADAYHMRLMINRLY